MPERYCRIAGPLAATAMLLLTQACASPPPPPPPTIAMLTLTATPDANATAAGSGAPTIVRVYQLTSTAAFEKAEFFRLLNSDAATLGTDLVKRDEYLIAPGTTVTETIPIPDRVQALGIFAAYRQFQNRPWRITLKLPPNKTTETTLSIAASGIATKP